MNGLKPWQSADTLTIITIAGFIWGTAGLLMAPAFNAAGAVASLVLGAGLLALAVYTMDRAQKLRREDEQRQLLHELYWRLGTAAHWTEELQEEERERGAI